MTRIEYLISQKGLDIKDVAAYVGVSGSAVSQWASGNKSPRPKNAEKLAELFGVSVDYLNGTVDAPSFPKGLSKALTDTVMELTIEECYVLRSLIDARILQLKAVADKAAKE